MSPKTPASYALILMVVLLVLLVAFRLVELALGIRVDSAWTTMFEAACTAVVGALVFVVHRNGSVR